MPFISHIRLQWSVWLFLLLLAGCQKEDNPPLELTPELMEIPRGFPEIEFPEGNAFSPSRWKLGKQLFFDPILSVDSSISCASCHLPELAFSDDKAFSPGVDNRQGVRNAPPLFNLAYHPYFTREGGVPTLEMQILVPIQEHNEFDFNIVLIADRLAQNPDYVAQAQTAYGRNPDPFVITRSIANFERSLLSGSSAYDRYENGENTQALSAAALRGRDLFFSPKTNCFQCHGGFNFTNYAFENNGLYEDYADPGRFRLTHEEADRALFKVPSLRNVAVTAPYMHDGSIASLTEVIEHYNSGGKNHPHKSDWVHPLNLTDQEKEDLHQFLQSLTDEDFLSNPNFRK